MLPLFSILSPTFCGAVDGFLNVYHATSYENIHCVIYKLKYGPLGLGYEVESLDRELTQFTTVPTMIYYGSLPFWRNDPPVNIDRCVVGVMYKYKIKRQTGGTATAPVLSELTRGSKLAEVDPIP